MNLRKTISYTAVLLLLVIPSCILFDSGTDDQVVARVNDKYLYSSELGEAIPEGSSIDDSIVIARRFIDAWIRNQLMLNKAEEALSDEQKDFDKKIEEYRASLLIYSYRQKLLLQKLDTVISESEIQEYYENNVGNFVLSGEIVKTTFVKVPLSAPNINSVRRWTRSADLDDLDQLEKYSINYADKFDTFNGNWVYFESLMDQIPLNITQAARYLRYNKDIETSDSLFHYFAHISEYKAEGEIIPLDLVRNDIKSILLNKRKIEFYNDLEKRIYNEGSNRNHFEIY